MCGSLLSTCNYCIRVLLSGTGPESAFVIEVCNQALYCIESKCVVWASHKPHVNLSLGSV